MGAYVCLGYTWYISVVGNYMDIRNIHGDMYVVGAYICAYSRTQVGGSPKGRFALNGGSVQKV